jgi:hypothetical protein
VRGPQKERVFPLKNQILSDCIKEMRISTIVNNMLYGKNRRAILIELPMYTAPVIWLIKAYTPPSPLSAFLAAAFRDLV